jgi:RNA polymerase sigma-70 factor (ECF subfamily)
MLDALHARGELSTFHLLHAARADLLRRLGREEDAIAAYRLAITYVGNDAERRFLLARLVALGASTE